MRGDEFIRMLSEARASELAIGVLTNGICLSDGMVEALVSFPTWVRVGLDAGRAETYAIVRGVQGGYERVLKTSVVWRPRAEAAQSDVRIGASVTVQQANIEEVELFLEVGHQYRLHRLDIKFVHGSLVPVATKPKLNELEDEATRMGERRALS